MFKNILLATDGSAASDRAAQLAVELASANGARLTALFVIDPYPYLGVGEASAVGFQSYMGHAYEHAALAHARVAKLCEHASPPVAVQLLRGEDPSPADEIVRVAAREKADLVVVGSHGRAGLSRIMLGSVAAKVVAASPAPVLVARGQQDA
jgi:nucleotide-binding universal stress UspA family protein